MLKGVICFGDSVIFGTGATNRNLGCGRVLRSLLKRPVLIRGKNNDTSRDALKRLKNDVLIKQEYSHVIVLFGNNDCKLVSVDTPCVSLIEYKDNLLKIINSIRQSGKTTLLSNLPPITNTGFSKSLPQIKKLMINIKSPSEWHKKYSDILSEVADSCYVKLIDIHSKLQSFKKRVMSEDGLHPNDFGHKVIAHEFKKQLLN